MWYIRKMKNVDRSKKAFTLAEVLITLGIIGIVAAITVPLLNNKIQDAQYKTAYRKSYAVISQALSTARANNNLVSFTGPASALVGIDAHFDALKQYFGVINDCPTLASTSACWASGEPYRGETTSPSFVDKAGMAWRINRTDGNLNANILLVDTNGNKEPNEYGKDRFPYALANHQSGVSGVPDSVTVGNDILLNTADSTEQTMCPSYATHACYYSSWLMGQ